MDRVISGRVTKRNPAPPKKKKKHLYFGTACFTHQTTSMPATIMFSVIITGEPCDGHSPAVETVARWYLPANERANYNLLRMVLLEVDPASSSSLDAQIATPAVSCGPNGCILELPKDRI